MFQHRPIASAIKNLEFMPLLFISLFTPEAIKGFSSDLFAGFGMIFGVFWLIIKMIPWWLWIILIVLEILSNKGSRRYSSRAFGGVKTFIDKYGYRRFSNSGKLVHRWVAEKKLNRKLEEEEVVHHINRDKLDNYQDNLEVLPDQEEHEKIHEYEDENDDYNDDDEH